MNILFFAGNDSDNIQTINIIRTLLKRGHALKIFSQHIDEHSLRMFSGMPVQEITELNNETIGWADCIFRAHPLYASGFLGNSTMAEKYTYIYSPYLDNHWHTCGGDFMFTCGTSRHPNHEEVCARMAVGCPKNDTVSFNSKASSDGRKMFLFIDSGHYPFSHLGKRQVAELLVKICERYPDFTLKVKPRFLPNDTNLVHANFDHLYDVIREVNNGVVPENMILPMEHIDMQEAIDESCCVILLCSSAYIDVALRGKNMIIVNGVDNEDKYDLRNDIEYKNIYALREESGCMVDISEVLDYLPYGKRCLEEHLRNVVAYTENASERIVDVMEYIHTDFISKGVFPKAQSYDYENLRTAIQSDPGLTWKTIKQNRLKNICNVTLNQFNKITSPMSLAPYFDFIDKKAPEYPLTDNGIQQMLEDAEKLRNEMIIKNKPLFMNDPLNQAVFFKALYSSKQYFDLLRIPQAQILCKGPWNFYRMCIEYKWGNVAAALNALVTFFSEANKRAFAQYECEERWNMAEAFVILAKFYNDRMSPKDFAMVYGTLYEKKMFSSVPNNERTRLFDISRKVVQDLLRNSEYMLASKVLLCQYNEQSYFDKLAYGKCAAEKENLHKEIDALKCSKSYKIGRFMTALPRAVRNTIRSLNEHGIRYALLDTKHRLAQKVYRNFPFKLIKLFKAEVLPGYAVYKNLIQKHGEDTYLELSAGGTGDVYISSKFYKSYIKHKHREQNALYVLPGTSCYNTAKLFDIDKIVNLDKPSWEALLKLYRFAGEPTVRIDVLYYHIFTVHTGYVTWLESFRGWNLYYLMKEIHFPMLSENDASQPHFSDKTAALDKLFADNQMVEGKTVVLSPYAKWPPAIKNGFWQNLSSRLKQEGYKVFTNSIGPEEPPILGTRPISFSYADSVSVLNKAGYVVGVRSGFLDIVESASCKKVAIYPHNCVKRGVANGNAMGSFSLNSMYGKNDWLELETNLDNHSEIIDTIISYFKEDK